MNCIGVGNRGEVETREVAQHCTPAEILSGRGYWIIASTALYGAEDRLGRAQEAFISNYYEQPLCISGSDVIYDVPGGVYHVMGMRNQEPEVNFNADIDRDLFTAESMRRQGIR